MASQPHTFKTFTDTLATPYLSAFNSLTSTTLSPHHLLEAHITILPKDGKDHTLVSNYRPISLLNVDTKLFAKILSNCLLPLIPSLASTDHVGFLLG